MSAPTFMGIAPEIRMLIYEYLAPNLPIARKPKPPFRRDKTPCTPSILRVSKQIYSEASEIWYRSVPYGIGLNQDCFLFLGRCIRPEDPECEYGYYDVVPPSTLALVKILEVRFSFYRFEVYPPPLRGAPPQDPGLGLPEFLKKYCPRVTTLHLEVSLTWPIFKRFYVWPDLMHEMIPNASGWMKKAPFPISAVYVDRYAPIKSVCFRAFYADLDDIEKILRQQAKAIKTFLLQNPRETQGEIGQQASETLLA